VPVSLDADNGRFETHNVLCDGAGRTRGGELLRGEGVWEVFVQQLVGSESDGKLGGGTDDTGDTTLVQR
jgi:predicted DNA-binding protein with PD1-like motif